MDMLKTFSLRLCLLISFIFIHFSANATPTITDSKLVSSSAAHAYLKSLLHFTHNGSHQSTAIIPVKVAVANTNWVTTISLCNTTTSTISLMSTEFSFHYASAMPTDIWGTPWLDWRLVGQVGDQVYLKGGTPWTPDYPSDPNCKNPITIQFNAPPTTSLPTGPYEFKANVDTPVDTGNLNVTVSAISETGVQNPTVTVKSDSFNQTQIVAWGGSWKLSGLKPATYTVSGTTVITDNATYTVDPVTANVAANSTAQATLTYKGGGGSQTGQVTVTLVNPPSSQVPVTLTGKNHTFDQSISNNFVWTLPLDTYTVSSNISGYISSASPNPLVVPNNKNLTISYVPSGSNTGARTITLVNQCPFPVWFGFISGATPNRNGGQCGSDADCYPGSTCVDRGAGGRQCFWKNPIPANNNFQLAANGGSNSIQFPLYQDGLNAFFSGAVAGRTKCTSQGCETADCGAGTGGCPAGRGFGQPATQAEFTLGVNSADFYDVEFINGMNLPVAMEPVLSGPKTGGPYDCGSPGSTVAQPPMGACSWDMVPPLVEYNWVRAGGAACNTNSNCSAPSVCGLSFNPGQNPLLKKTCGTRLGYWTANQICGVQGNYGAPFNCQMKLPPPQNDLAINNLLGCTNVGSCYQPGASTRCCGCANWDKLGTGVPPAPFTTQCINSNPNWVQNIQPTLLWLKTACPSLYTYPFDDMSSTFICTIMKDQGGRQVNSVNYKITFCPGGKTGGVVS